MMIQERISGTLAGYDYTTNTWAKGEIQLNDNNIISAKIDRQCCKDSAPEIGGVYAASLRMTVKLPAAWNSYNLRGCRVVLCHNLNNAEADAPLGVFWITSARKQGGKNSPIFDLEGLDAVGWLDVSSYNINLSRYNFARKITMGAWLALWNSSGKMIDSLTRDGYFAAGWLPTLTELVNDIIQDMNGVQNMLTWRGWDFSANGEYINAYIWNDGNEAKEVPDYTPIYFSFHNYTQDDELHLEDGCDKLDSDVPRELFSQLAEVAGGYIFARESGELSLGQFMMRETPALDIRGIAEADNFGYANYVIRIGSVMFGAESSKEERGAWESTGYSVRVHANAHEENIYINWNIETNIAANSMLLRRGKSDGDWYSSAIWAAFYSGYHDKGYKKNTPEWVANWHASPTFRPFKAQIFPQNYTQIPHLGGAVLLDTMPGDSYEIWSTITRIQWTLHGGYMIQCAGEDCRTMADSVNRSGAERTGAAAKTWLRAIGG